MKPKNKLLGLILFVGLLAIVVYAQEITQDTIENYAWGNFTNANCTHLYNENVSLDGRDITQLDSIYSTIGIMGILDADIDDLQMSLTAIKAYGVDTGSFAIPSDQATLIPFDTEEFDTKDEWNGEYFNATKKGYYYAKAQILIENHTTNYEANIAIIDQYFTPRLRYGDIIKNETDQTLSVEGSIWLDAGDKLYVKAYQNSGATKEISLSAEDSFISIHAEPLMSFGTPPDGVYTDPVVSIVENTTQDDAIFYGYHDNMFVCNGRYWVFYNYGQKLVYKSSTDGSSWGNLTNVTDCDNSGCFDIYFNGSAIEYATVWVNSVYYRKGMPLANGSINWLDTEKNPYTSSFGSSYIGRPSITNDDSGYAWIFWVDLDNWGILNSVKNGGWSTDSSETLYNSELSTTLYLQGIGTINNKVTELFTMGSYQSIYTHEYSGSYWSSRNDAGTRATNGQFKGLNDNGSVAVAYYKDNYGDIGFIRKPYGSSWGSEVIVVDTSEESHYQYCTPTIFMDREGSYYVVYYHGNSIDEIRMCKSLDKGQTWSEPFTLVDNIDIMDGNSEYGLPLYYSEGTLMICFNEDNTMDSIQVAIIEDLP